MGEGGGRGKGNVVGSQYIRVKQLSRDCRVQPRFAAQRSRRREAREPRVQSKYKLEHISDPGSEPLKGLQTLHQGKRPGYTPKTGASSG